MRSHVNRFVVNYLSVGSVSNLRKMSLGLRALTYFPLFYFRNKILLNGDDEIVLLLSMGWSGGSPILAKELHKRGYRVILVSSGLPSYEMQYIWGWIRVDATDLIQLERVVGKFAEMNVVFVFSEMKNILLPGVSFLSKKLGLPGVSGKAASTSNSKIYFRQALEERGLNNICWGVVEENPAINFPVIVKPERGTGSRGVLLARNKEEYTIATLQLEAGPLVGGRFMYEELLEGDQYDVEGVTQNGTHFVVVRVLEKYERVKGKFPTSWYLLNCPISPDKQKLMDAYVTSCLDALGVVEGAWHLELKEISPGRFSAIDYSNRMGYPNMISSAIGQSFPGLYIDALGRGMSQKKLENENKSLVFQKYIYTVEEANAFRRLAKDSRADIVEYKDTRNQVAGVDLYGRIAFRCNRLEPLLELLAEYGVCPADFNIDLSKR